MGKTILLTLGRLPKALELARALAGAGNRVLIAEPFASHLSKPSRSVEKSFHVSAPNDDLNAYLDEMRVIIEAERVDIVAPVSEEVLYAVLLRDRLPDSAAIWAPPFESLRRLHDKFAFARHIESLGLRCPATERADDAAAAAIMDEGAFVMKPALGCSGAGLRFFEEGARPENGADLAGAIVQQRITGREVSSFSIAHEGRVIGSVIYEAVIRSGTVATNFQRVDDAHSALSWIDEFVRREKYSGYVAFDFIVDDAGEAWPIECNPRLTSGIHFMDHADLAAALITPEAAREIDFRKQRRFQEGHTSLLEAYGAILQPKEFVRRLGAVFTTRDVLWSWDDPAPFVLMTPMSWRVLSQVLFKGMSFGEAATRDIEWREAALIAAPRATPGASDTPINFTQPTQVLDDGAR
ncbi:MAG: ATP-grasp domain-containing protein [Pseudomonadota bacterium]